MFFFFDLEHPVKDPESGNLGVVKVKNLRDYRDAKVNLKKLKDLYDEMGIRKEEIDDEAEAVIEAIQEQEKQIHDFAPRFEEFDSKYLGTNIELLLKRELLRISDLEVLLDVSAGYISRTINPDSKKRLSIDIVWKIAEIFQVNIDDLVNRNLDSPTKDLKQVMDFLEKLKDQTDAGEIRWKDAMSRNEKSQTENLFYTVKEDGKPVYSPQGDGDPDAKILEAYRTDINIGTIYIVKVDHFLGDIYQIHVFDESRYEGSWGTEYEPVAPLTLICESMLDNTGIIERECDKILKAINTHKYDFTVSQEARDYMNQFLNPRKEEFTNIPDELPFN